MADIFSQILNMSLTGSLVIAVVLLARASMRKLPKIFSYALWAVVLFRLLCPASISGPGSLLELLQPQVQEATDAVSVVSYLPIPEDLPEFQFVPAEVADNQTVTAKREFNAMDIFGCLWITGFSAMALYGAAQYLLLRKRLIGAIRWRSNIYLADHIDTAFVMGILFPKVYLPSHVPFSERKYILAHERHHIRRGDHIVKLLAYGALCMHWFNPLVWLAFLLAGKDMEMSCDEAVIRRFGSQIRADYSASLLRLAAHRKPVPGMPLAFGEGDTKGRIMNMAKWKKPKLWVSILCVVLCIAILAACAVNPMQENKLSNDAAVTENTAAPDSLPAFSEEHINILITGFADEEQAIPDMSLLLSVHPDFEKVTMATILKDTYVSLPDYQGHITSDNRFGVCYALGRAWGGTEGAVEMVNQCILDNFEITVDHNMELIGEQYNGLMDVLREILGQLDSSLASEAQDISNQLLSMIAGTNNSRTLEQTKQKLAAAIWESCTLPYEGTYTGEQKNIAGEKVWVLVMNDDADASQPGQTGDEYMPTIQGPDIVTDTELVQYGSLKLLLLQGYSSRAEGQNVILCKDGIDVGGIRCYNAPSVPFEYSLEYLAAMGVPEAILAQQGEEPIAYMMGGNIGSGTVAEFFHELKPETLNVKHNFYMDGDLIYDLYFDANILTDVQADKFLKTVEIAGEPLYPAQPEEEESLILCRNLVDLVRSGAHQIVSEQENQGGYALNGSSTTVYTGLKDDWVSITHVPDDDSYHGYMNVNGTDYSNEGNGWDADGSVHWYEDPYPDAVYVPWIASFQWNEGLITYVDTLTEEGRKTVMLRIDEPFPGYEDMTECYFVNINFTEDGSFIDAQIEIVFAQGSEVNYVEITEAIVTLDEETVDNYVQKEYSRAVNEN